LVVDAMGIAINEIHRYNRRTSIDVDLEEKRLDNINRVITTT